MSRFVCIFAHPDDESFGAGGTIATLSRDSEVYAICATDGNHQAKNLKSVRDTELQTAAKILGIKKVFQLDFSDGYLSNAIYHDLAEKISSILDEIKPDTIIAFHPNGVSGHIDHITVTSVVNYLFPKLAYVKNIWYLSALEGQERPDYFVHWPKGESLKNINHQVDISGVLDIKKQAILAHTSQLDGSIDQLNRLLSSQTEYFLVRSKGE